MGDFSKMPMAYITQEIAVLRRAVDDEDWVSARAMEREIWDRCLQQIASAQTVDYAREIAKLALTTVEIQFERY